jgi:hypothetical protein
MALTPTEEAQVLALVAQEAALLSLAAEEPAIISNLGATDVSLSDLTAATTPADADLLLIRQGTTDKSVAASVLAAYIAAEVDAGFVNVSGDTMTGILALFAGSTVPTPALFDTTTRIASTSFVMRALGNHSDSVTKTGAFSVVPADMGKHLDWSDSVSRVCTLPNTSTVAAGSKINISNSATSPGINLTLTPAAGQIGGTVFGGLAASHALHAGSQVELVSNGTNWLAYNGSGTSARTQDGFIRFPGGVMVQWGRLSINGATPTTGALPTTFPNNAWGAVATRVSGTAIAAAQSACSANVTTSQITVAPDSTSTGTRDFFWIAIGS